MEITENKPKKLSLKDTFTGLVDQEMARPQDPNESPIEEIGGALYRGGKQAVQDFGSGVSQIGNSIWEGTKKAGSAIGDAASNVGRGLAEAGKATGKFVEENPAFLMGATPVLMGFLTGNYEDGYGVASKTLMDEAGRRQKEADSEKEFLRKYRTTLAGKGGKNQLKTVYDKPTGEEKLAVFNPEGYLMDDEGNKLDMERYSHGPSLSTKYAARNKADIEKAITLGTNRVLVEDKATGLKSLVDKGTGKTLKMPSKDRFNPVQLGVIDEAQKRSFSMGKEVESFKRLEESLKNIVKSDNPVAIKAAITGLAKDMQGGKLSDFDVKYIHDAFGGPDFIKEWANQKFSGDVTQLQKRVYEVLKDRHAAGKKHLKQRYSEIHSMGKHRGIDPKTLKEYTGDFDTPDYTDDFETAVKKEKASKNKGSSNPTTAIVSGPNGEYRIPIGELGVLKDPKNKGMKVLGYE